MEKVETPRVEQVTLSESAGGQHRFEIVIENPTRKEFLIKEIDIGAFKPGMKADCCCPPTAVFLLRDDIKFAMEGYDNKQAFAAKFEEALRGKGYLTKAQGEIERDNCEQWQSLSLKLNTAVGLPANQYTTIFILLPPRLRIYKSEFKYGSKDTTPKTSDAQNGSIGVFRSFRFTFRLGENSEIEISGEYNR